MLEEELLPDGLVYPRLQVPLVLDAVVLSGEPEVLYREVGLLALEVEPEGLGEREVEVHGVQMAPSPFCRSGTKIVAGRDSATRECSSRRPWGGDAPTHL